LIDMTSKGLTGKEASTALARAGIVTNANAIPFDPRKPFDPSGVRIGTPAVTSRGLLSEHMDEIARWLDEVVEAARTGEDDVFARVKAEVNDLMERYPAPGCRSSAVTPATVAH
jgi:glycine hydroxymethyltransferase